MRLLSLVRWCKDALVRIVLRRKTQTPVSMLVRGLSAQSLMRHRDFEAQSAIGVVVRKGVNSRCRNAEESDDGIGRVTEMLAVRQVQTDETH